MGQPQSKASPGTPPAPPSPSSRACEQARNSTPQGQAHLTPTLWQRAHLPVSSTTAEQIKLSLGRLPEADQLSETRHPARRGQAQGTVMHNGERVQVMRVQDLEEGLEREMRMGGHGGLGGYGGEGCKRLTGGKFITGQCYEFAHKCSGCCITTDSCGRY